MTTSGERRKIAVAFPIDMFKKIKRRAEQAKVPFSTMVVDICKCGLLDLEDLERTEKEGEPNHDQGHLRD